MHDLFQNTEKFFLKSFAISLLSVASIACPRTTQDTTSTKQNGPWNPPALREIQLAPLPEPDKVISIFFTADVHGYTEPCGCAADPLGGIARLGGYIKNAKADPKSVGSILVDAGDLLFEKTSLSFDREGKIETAELIVDVWNELGLVASLIGPRDIPENGPDLSKPPFSTLPKLNASNPENRRIVKEIDGFSIGVFGAAAKESGAPAAEDPVAAAKEDVAFLQKEGVKLIVALVYEGKRSDLAETIAKIEGIDFIVVATGDPSHLAKSPEDSSLPKQVENALILTPFSQGQSIGEIQLRIVGDDLSFEDGGLSSRQAEKAREQARRMEPLIEGIKKAEKQKKDSTSLRDAVARLEAKYELAAKEAEEKVSGSHFVTNITLLSSKVSGDKEMEEMAEAFQIKLGEKYKRQAENETLPEPKEGKAGYVGADTCRDCHESEYEFWKDTKHFIALETLVKDKRDGHPDCVECHVAGFRKPGGTTLISRVNELGGVQCENCHGPGSIHIENLGYEKTPSLTRMPGEALCRKCHYPPHTNDFVFDERIKKIVGPGHQAKDSSSKPKKALLTP